MPLCRGVLVKWCRSGVHRRSLFSEFVYRNHYRNHRIFRTRIRVPAAVGEIFLSQRRTVSHGQDFSDSYKNALGGASSGHQYCTADGDLWGRVQNIFARQQGFIRIFPSWSRRSMFEIFIFLCVGLWVVFLVSSNLTRPFKNIIQALHKH